MFLNIKKLITNQLAKLNEKNEMCIGCMEQITQALHDSEMIFEAKQAFIEPREYTRWKMANQALLDNDYLKFINTLKGARRYRQLLKKYKELCDTASRIPKQISDYNHALAKELIPDVYKRIGNVEGQRLDQQQMSAIALEVYNQLVIAGAGTGKTTTIIGKIKYLLETEKCKTEDILVLSFTHDSANEMSKRIADETGYSIQASTFHKLGVNIIASVEGKRPSVTSLDMRKFIGEQLDILMQSDDYCELLYSYLMFQYIIPKTEFEFHSQEEYDDYLKYNSPITIKKEPVKSYGELDIANFLARMGVEYIYEHTYEIDTADTQHRGYIPDFYLPEYGIYIEYFGINRNGEVPAYFSASNGMTASESYRASMDWKRKIHKKNNTTMIETYAYEKWEGKLLENLECNLRKKGVEFHPISLQELWAENESENNRDFENIVSLFESVLSQIKGNDDTIPMIEKRCKGTYHESSSLILLELLKPIYDAYCKYLIEHREIDFNDMINMATHYVQTNKYINSYKYVIVDEYQDISKTRYKLLKAMRESFDFKLFCVGDDWQSIYRFNGSDIGYILEFEKYWGLAEISRIETTYRFSHILTQISGDFVMRNPRQIKKTMRGKSDVYGFPLGDICGFTENKTLDFLLQKLDLLPTNSTVFFVGRYAFDKDIFAKNPHIQYKWNNIKKVTEIVYDKRRDLQMEFMTAHKSKGLQSDYVFIINNKNSIMGFPSKKQDVPLMAALLQNSDTYPYAEERRLFYVALTRAKKKVYLLTVKGKESLFASELKQKYSKQIEKERWTCPRCGGKLVKRRGKYGDFYGCSNYSRGCSVTKDI